MPPWSCRRVQPGCSFVELYLRIWERLEAGHTADADLLYRQLVPYLSAWMQGVEIVIAVEKEISRRRALISSAHCRSPAHPLDAHEHAQITDFLERLGPETPGAGSLFRLEPDGAAADPGRGDDLQRTRLDSRRHDDVFHRQPNPAGAGLPLRLGAWDCWQPRTVVDIPAPDGLPDGMTIDSDGCLWVAMFGGGTVRRFTPDGRCDMVVDLPVSQVTSCTFGGPDLRQLFITTSSYGLDAEHRAAESHAGAVFGYYAPVNGLPADRYAG